MHMHKPGTTSKTILEEEEDRNFFLQKKTRYDAHTSTWHLQKEGDQAYRKRKSIYSTIRRGRESGADGR